MYSDKDGDEFLEGWSSQLVLRTLEFNAVDHARDAPMQAVGDLWGRRKSALQFLVSRSPDVTARVLLSPLFCEQTNPALRTQLEGMCEHALGVDRAFWTPGAKEIPGQVPQEEVTFAATVMKSVSQGDGVFDTYDVLSASGLASSPSLCSGGGGDVLPSTFSVHRAQARVAAAQRLASLVQPCETTQPSRPGHTTLSLRARTAPSYAEETAFLMRGVQDTSVTDAWPSMAPPRLTHPGDSFLASLPLPCRARSLREQLEAEAIEVSRTAEAAAALDEDTRIIEEPQWAREERQQREREAARGERAEAEHGGEARGDGPSSSSAAEAPAEREAVNCAQLQTELPRPQHPPPERTVVGEDEELVIAGGKFVVRKKIKPRMQKEEKPKPEVVHPGVSHHDRKRLRDADDGASKKHGATKNTRSDTALDATIVPVVSLAEIPLLTRAEVAARLQDWDLSAALREALSIGLESAAPMPTPPQSEPCPPRAASAGGDQANHAESDSNDCGV